MLETPECLREVAQVRRYRRDVGSFDGRPVSRWNGAEAEQRAVFVDESTCGLLAILDNLEWAPPKNFADGISICGGLQVHWLHELHQLRPADLLHCAPTAIRCECTLYVLCHAP